MTKGFITLATGSERYFELAVNLLKSYRLFSDDPLPFAILADRNNKFTEQFDEVIILENAKSSYMDKLSILINCPYDETIFIDADCLAYQDLNQYWEIYDFAHTISCFGFAGPLNYRDGWFYKEDIGKYGKLIKFIPSMHGGCYFIKKSAQCQEIYELALEINNNYSSYKFKYFDSPADEPILALCMAIFDCRPIAETGQEIVFYPAVKNFKANIFHGFNSFKKKDKIIKNAWLVHWQNNFTKRAIYKLEVDKLNLLFDKVSKFNLQHNQSTNKINLFLQSKIKLNMLFYKNVDFLYDLNILFKTQIMSILKKYRS